MKDFLSRVRATWLGALLVLALASPVFAGQPRPFIVFGDSLSDPGNAFVLLGTDIVPPFQSLVPSAPYARGGHHFSNGKTWIEQLVKAGPALRNPGVFFNYAVGGSRARLAGPYDLTGQVSRYLADAGGQAAADAVYVVWIGGDDLRDAVVALATDPSGAQSALILQQAIGVIQNNLLLLYGAGARNFLVPNLPDLGLAPEAQSQGPIVQFYASFFTQQFNAGLEQMLSGLQAGLGVPVGRVDVFALHHAIAAAPASFGFSIVSAPCIRLNTTVQPYCDAPGEYLFWDGVHPTVAGHQAIARRASAVISVMWPQ
ncbi:SGNH/GDSL hydrolase family protein [Cupriavidus lacunae]|uniref:GDSL family lipase n=1 Tax=Cupriavidus lacunae TaxID=2666307 RepID=A0A370NMI6_9BURK|nr:SGNH/GDSL hydrolase family protein [Cupriavidus lacunae]RDK06826.1 GDSL family lipase [Cupriavidus lacunae]